MKNIVLISPDTFGYYKTISAAISKAGFNPIWLNQLPDASVFSRIIFRLAPAIASRVATRHFVRELTQISDVEQILIIKGEGVSKATIAKMRTLFPRARIVFYLWDSLANVPGAREKYTLCDAAFSFDPVDCVGNQGLEHLPLFYSKCVRERSVKRGFAAFIGTLHSNRYTFISSLGKEINKITGVAPFLYFYYPHRWLFRLQKIFKRSFRMVKEDELHFYPLSRDLFAKIDAESEIAIDICHPKQSGLTMRTIEAIGSGKKLITNNRNVERYDFFTPRNHHVITGRGCEGLVDFLNSDYQKPPFDLVSKYHIDTWLKVLLGFPDGEDGLAYYFSDEVPERGAEM